MIAIIDYDAGNLTSVARALSHLSVPCEVTNDPQKIADADAVIFPGVGAAGSAMQSLKRLGLDFVIQKALDQGKPVLGICLGTQIIMSRSQEDANTACLDIIAGETVRFPGGLTDNRGNRLKIPHMGWNQVKIVADHPVLSGLDPEDAFYFVHSYYPQPRDPGQVLGRTEYGIAFPAIIGSKNLIATQFHPEKSGRPGLRILQNFCEWRPC